MTDEQFFKTLEFGRAALVGLFFFFSALILGVGFLKAAFLFTGIFLFQAIKIGTRRIEQLALLFFLLATFNWMNLLPIDQWSKALTLRLTQYHFAFEIGSAQ